MIFSQPSEPKLDASNTEIAQNDNNIEPEKSKSPEPQAVIVDCGLILPDSVSSNQNGFVPPNAPSAQQTAVGAEMNYSIVSLDSLYLFCFVHQTFRHLNG